MVDLKTTTVSYKVHKLIRKPEEEWSIVPNAQEAIIDENTWIRVQELRKNKRRPTATGKTSLLSESVFCADCGPKLHFCAAKSLKADQEFFRCANYKSGRGECTIHYIRNVALEQIISMTVSDLADLVTCHESFFLQMIGISDLSNRTSLPENTVSMRSTGRSPSSMRIILRASCLMSVIPVWQ